MFWDEPIDTLLRVFHHELESRLLGHLTSAYLRGSAQMVEWGRTKTTDRPIFYEGPPIVDAMEYARKHCAVMVTKMDEETKRQLAQVISEAIENKRGIPGLTRDIKSQFADMTRYRAEMIARTETCDALEQAFMDRSEKLGVNGKRWIVTDPCPVCEALGDVGTVPIDYDYAQDGHEGLDTTRPPAHPNAVLEGTFFAPYGGLKEIVRSRYRGPAVTIDTERVSFTIGFNHPVLTRRGWIKSSEVQEGDYLLYDSRAENAVVASVESDFDQVHTVEDVFDSLRSSCGHSTVAAAGANLHGDEVFAYGEVEVIAPERDLLFVLDPCGIQKLTECQLNGAYPDLLHVSGCRSCNESFGRILTPSTGNVGSVDLMTTLFSGHRVPSPFESLRVMQTHKCAFEGWAYDARTQYGLYNSSGIVVKNCRCALAPVILGVTEADRGRDEGGRFAPTGRAEPAKRSKESQVRAERAKQSHNPATKEKHARASAFESRVAETIGGTQTPDNAPFDVVIGNNAIECKLVATGAKAEKVTMHPESLERKVKMAESKGLTPHTVVYDERNGQLYYKEGVGSFRFATMTPISYEELKGVLS